MAINIIGFGIIIVLIGILGDRIDRQLREIRELIKSTKK